MFSFAYTQKLVKPAKEKNKMSLKDFNNHLKIQNNFLAHDFSNFKNSNFLESTIVLNNFFKKNNLKNFFYYLIFLNKNISSNFF